MMWTDFFVNSNIILEDRKPQLIKNRKKSSRTTFPNTL